MRVLRSNMCWRVKCYPRTGQRKRRKTILSKAICFVRTIFIKMSSGVSVASEAKTAYDEVKKDKKYRYIIYHIKDERVIDVEHKGPRSSTYENFIEKLQNYKSECRYCVFDFPLSVAVEGSQKSSPMTVDRLILMMWCPESSPIKHKMLYSSSYDALKKALVGIYKYVQACDFDEVSKDVVEDTLKRGGK
ncbi:cofilin/actin-depolymerizing factor homolog [Tachypleus tridentatus]|uniref:cofilin/actin-depolymerizing factor homolog n=1 Tax=Tachypleus tridentatus TaxID=6853 RepID=UPI003FD59048